MPLSSQDPRPSLNQLYPYLKAVLAREAGRREEDFRASSKLPELLEGLDEARLLQAIWDELRQELPTGFAVPSPDRVSFEHSPFSGTLRDLAEFVRRQVRLERMFFDRADPRPDISQNLDKTRFDLALIQRMNSDPSGVLDVILDLNLLYVHGLADAKERAKALIKDAVPDVYRRCVEPYQELSDYCPQYIFARGVEPYYLRELARLLEDDAAWSSVIWKVWLDQRVQATAGARATSMKSLPTIKADAARIAFSAEGEGIAWAVIDSGVDAQHPHFQKHRNLDLSDAWFNGIAHRDFVDPKSLRVPADDTQPLPQPADPFGHGTHVAAILAGELDSEGQGVGEDDPGSFAVEYEMSSDQKKPAFRRVASASGVAPKCRLLSLRVLDDEGGGNTSDVMAALGYVAHVNHHGRDPMRIHGVNLSLGFLANAQDFGCGQSPLCREVDRLVRLGVVVVVAAGNSGFGTYYPSSSTVSTLSAMGTVNDPGNAALAITVGATHRNEPHTYGVSYFSSKGPTADGRLKPDLVAPGEAILSAITGKKSTYPLQKAEILGVQALKDGQELHYGEDSGTSMAAPHVSGAIAAFLSIRREFIGEPERLKEIFVQSATDLGRERYFQGHGLLDLMRAIQSV